MMPTSIEEFNRALDLLLSKVRPRERTVNAFKIARRMDFIPATSNRIEGSNAQVSYINSRWKIIVNKFDPPEVQQLLMAHEMFEILLSDGPDKTELCKAGASLFLIKPGLFEATCKSSCFNLFTLKEAFPFLSYDSIALRSLVLRPAIVTVLEGDKIITRAANPGLSLAESLTDMETEAARRAAHSGTMELTRDGDRETSAWPIVEKGVSRIILVTASLRRPISGEERAPRPSPTRKGSKLPVQR